MPLTIEELEQLLGKEVYTYAFQLGPIYPVLITKGFLSNLRNLLKYHKSLYYFATPKEALVHKLTFMETRVVSLQKFIKQSKDTLAKLESGMPIEQIIAEERAELEPLLKDNTR